MFINDCHNTGGENNSTTSIFEVDYDSLLVIENISITNCSDNFYDAPIFSISSYYADNPFLRMSNVLIANNSSIDQSPIMISNRSDNIATISNCSFINNIGSNYAVKLFGKMTISNCIFDNDTQSEISIGQIINSSSEISFSNNLIRNYPNSIYIYPTNQITFNPFNFSADPCFAGTDWTDPLSYRLNYNSPCIDAGMPDTTGLYLPEFDLFGNPRIYNGIIDIGCYEWDGTANQDSTIPLLSDDLGLQVYPNPFNLSTTILYAIPKDMPATLTIYNLKGQKIKTLIQWQTSQGHASANLGRHRPGRTPDCKRDLPGNSFLPWQADKQKADLSQIREASVPNYHTPLFFHKLFESGSKVARHFILHNYHPNSIVCQHHSVQNTPSHCPRLTCP